MYSPYDPKDKINVCMVNTAFISQAYPNIWKKLQKLEGFEAVPMTRWINIAQKVYAKEKKPLLAAAIRVEDLKTGG